MSRKPTKLQPGVKYGKLKSCAKSHNNNNNTLFKEECLHPNYYMSDNKMLCRMCCKVLSSDPEEIEAIKKGYELNPQAMMVILCYKFQLRD